MAEVDCRRKLVIAGGSGYLGSVFTRYLLDQEGDGWEIVILSRSKPAFVTQSSAISHVTWDGRTEGDWTSCLVGATHILNLAGRSVDCRKTPARCDEILRSRVESTTALGKAIADLEVQPAVWVQMSTAHIYGDPPSAICDESSTLGYGLAPSVGRAWESAFEDACPSSTRGVILRTSFVLGNSGGAFATLRRVASLGLGGRMGSGNQGISWIHEHDMNRVFEDALINDARRGVYIATAPEPVSYLDFMRALRKELRQPIALPGPEWGLRLLCATLMDSDPELVLYGRYCIPKRLLDEGFGFEFISIEEALRDLAGS